MPITIPDDLPARRTLEAEGVLVMRESDAVRQDIRPLRIGLLNLMPDKISTETQLARLLGATPLQIELTLVRITDHVARNTPAGHIAAFYQPWSDVSAKRFDGFIITGAPIERLPFEEVSYWPELRSILDWTQTHVHGCLTLCWAAQAALYHFHGVPKHELPRKAFGVFPHRNLAPTSPYLRGFADASTCPCRGGRKFAGPTFRRIVDCASWPRATKPVSAWSRTRCTARYTCSITSNTTPLRSRRNIAATAATSSPPAISPATIPSRAPTNSWRSHGHLLFGNWINEIYQSTPFDPAAIGSARKVDSGTLDRRQSIGGIGLFRLLARRV